MLTIKDYLNSVTQTQTLSERKGGAVVFTFGRFNPPTSGHEKLIDAVKRVAKRTRAEHRIYPSHSEDPKKNPLPHKVKVKYMRKFYRGAKIVDDKNAKSPFHVCKDLSDKGYKHVILVVGGDRVEELKKLISQYINHPDPKKSFNFDKFEVVSAGERDPDAEGISGMSASKMRASAGSGDLESFKRGLPSTASDKDARDLFIILRKSMGIMEPIEEDISLDEGIKDIVKKLKRIPSVVKKIKDTANLSSTKAASALFTIPAVTKMLTPQNLNHGSLVVNSLRQAVLGEQLLREPEILDRLVQQLRDKGMEKNRAYAVATSQLQKNGVLKKGSQDLTKHGEKRNSMSAAERAKDRAAKKDGKDAKDYNYNPRTNTATQKEEIELDEITRQARLKMSRAAKRSARKRVASRKRKQKRMKGADQLKSKAQKGARSVFKDKMLKGRKWSELSYAERETIDKRLKKINPNRLETIAKKLLPGIRQQERERISKLRGGDNMPAMGEEKERDYKKEYQNYHGKPEQIKRRAKRVQARRDLEKEGRVSKGDGKDVDHKDGNPLNNNSKNLRVTSIAHNRSRNNNKGKNEELAKGSSGKKQLEVGTDLTLDVYSGAVPGQKKTVKDFLKRGKK
tara:strand:+ start:11391 stop:13262 length:1872 start_codon:yes stop_codon:yes gene_type:complete